MNGQQVSEIRELHRNSGIQLCQNTSCYCEYSKEDNYLYNTADFLLFTTVCSLGDVPTFCMCSLSLTRVCSIEA